MSTDIKDYIHYYIGQQFTYGSGCPLYTLKGIMPYESLRNKSGDEMRLICKDVDGQWDEMPLDEHFKLCVRRLEDMTEDEMIGLLQSMVPADMEDKPTDEDYNLEMFYHDGGNLVDGDILIGAEYSCSCYQGQIGIRECGSIILHDEGGDVERTINQPQAFHYLLSLGFDLFGLIDSGMAIDAKPLQPLQQ